MFKNILKILGFIKLENETAYIMIFTILKRQKWTLQDNQDALVEKFLEA